MKESINSTLLANSDFDDGDCTTMIKVENVSMVFNIANEKYNSLKEYAIALARREFMFKEFRALDGVSFEVKKGDVFGIMGTNGSGKSTMLKVIAGVLEPSEGTCEVSGQIAPLIELGAGFDMELTARENIYLNGALLGYKKKFIEQHFDDIVSFAEIEEFLDMPLKNYSSGMVARIAFAIATVIIPDILIVDEVLSVGDFMFQQKCERRITELIVDHEVTVLIVSHSNDQIERLCNKAIWIEKGHTRMMGSAHDVCRVYRVLGGHKGSEESERKIIEILKEEPPVSSHVDIETIAGEDRYDTCVELNKKQGATICDTAVVTVGDDSIDRCLSAALAGLYEAPCYLIKPDAVPYATYHFLEELMPRTIVLIGREGVIENKVEDELVSLCTSDVTRVTGNSLFRLAMNTYLNGSERDALNEDDSRRWSNLAVVLDSEDTICAMSVAPHLISRKVPVFFLSDSPEENEELITTLAAGFQRVAFVEYNNESTQRWLNCSASLNLPVDLFSCAGSKRRDVKVVDWLLELESEVLSPVDHLFITDAGNASDAYSACMYASSDSSRLLLVDPKDLDDMVAGYDYVRRNMDSIHSVTFLGGTARLSNSDREIIIKALG